MGGKFGDVDRISRDKSEEIVRKFIDMVDNSLIIEWEILGSYRRGLVDSGDIELFMLMKSGWENELGKLIGFAKNGNVKRMYVLDGHQIDLFVTEHVECVGAMKLHATGNYLENTIMRGISIKKGWLLNQYGLYRQIEESEFVEDNPIYYRKRARKSDPWECYRQIAGRTEKAIYEALGLKFNEPKDRDGTAIHRLK